MKLPLDDQERFGLHLGLAARLWRAEIGGRRAEAATPCELAEAVGCGGRPSCAPWTGSKPRGDGLSENLR